MIAYVKLQQNEHLQSIVKPTAKMLFDFFPKKWTNIQEASG